MKIKQTVRDVIVPQGMLTIQVRDSKTDRLLDVFKIKNLVVTIGKNLLRDFIHGDFSSNAGLKYFAIGTGTTAPTVNDSLLGNEVYRNTPTKKVKSPGQLDIDLYVSSQQANGNNLTEAGLFCDNASASANTGKLYSRAVHTAINKTSSISITYTWTLTWT